MHKALVHPFRCRGFTLTELLVAVAMAGILLGIVGFNFKGQNHRASSKSVGLLLTETLRQAHMKKAQADQRPVAIVLPSSNGTRPHSVGFYVLEGYGEGKVVRASDFAGEGNEGEMFVGVWPVAAPYSNSLNVSGPPTETIDLNSWLPAFHRTDYAFVFLPNGNVQTNDLPAFDGSYHILVGSAFEYGSTGAPPGNSTVTAAPSYFAPTKAGDSYTISLSFNGKITMNPGVLGNTGTVDVGAGGGSSTPPATPVVFHPPGNSAPILEQIVVTPTLDPAVAPPGVDTVVRVGDHLTLTVTASDPDSDELFCRWQGSFGEFSAPGETRMVWDEALKKRVSIWTWTPPSTALAGDSFTLSCTVRDESGNVAAPIVGSVFHVETEEQGRLYYKRGPLPYTSRPDGSGERPLDTSAVGNWREVHALSQGNRICYSYRPPGATRYEVWLSNRDGTNARQLVTDPGANLNWARMNPQGTAIQYTRAASGNYQIWICDADGTNNRKLFTSPSYPDTRWASWSPDGSQVAFLINDSEVRVADLDPVTFNVLSTSGPIPAPGDPHYVEWSPEVAPRLMVHGTNGGSTYFNIHLTDGTLSATLPPVPAVSAPLACWSPDGTQLVYGNYDDLWLINSDGTNARHILSGPGLNFPVWVP